MITAFRYWDDQLKEDELDGSFNTYVEMRYTFKIIASEPHDKLANPQRRWKQNIKI
jgi:hypothetical protein